MHWAALVPSSMDPRQVNAVAGWREARRFFGERERAALHRAEAVDALPQRSPSDADFDQATAHLSEAELPR